MKAPNLPSFSPSRPLLHDGHSRGFLPPPWPPLSFAGKKSPLPHFLALYTILLTAIYSAISYKTPWCLLSFFHGMILLAGIGAAALVEFFRALPLSVSVRIVPGRDDLAERGSVSRNRAGVLPALDLLALAHSNSLLGDLVTLNNLFVLQNCVLGITPFSIGPGQ